MKNRIQLLILSIIIIMLSACGGDDNYDFAASVEEAQQNFDANNTPSTVAGAIFDPANSLIPPTNNLLFGQDGTLDIPVSATDTEGAVQLKTTLNELDGFSTVNPIVADFSNPLDSTTLQIGNTLHMYEVTATPQGAVTGVVSELTAAQVFATASGDNQTTLALLPLQPLKSATTYMVVLTKGIKGADSVPVESSVPYILAKGGDVLSGHLAALEPLRQLVNTYEAAAASQGVAGEDIILSWAFTTLDTTTVLNTVATNIQNNPPSGALTIVSSGLDTTTFVPGSPGLANVYFGKLAVPYYLEAGSLANPGPALGGFWKGSSTGSVSRVDPVPALNSTEVIPVLMTVPKAGAPAAGYPVVIFQHGITQDRSNLLAIADQLAARGLVAIAIDMPLHGITDTSNPLNAASSTVFADDVERTFGIDVVNNVTGEAEPDGLVDFSGTHFINLASLLTSRDNVRQAAVDLMFLKASLGDSTVALDLSKIGFIGHSLGGIVGTTFLAFDDSVDAASIAMAGGGIARLLDASVSFGPRIEAGLAANGVIKGTTEYDQFMAVAQAALDAADPINHAASAATSHNIHFIEVIGGNSSPADLVIPNNVTTAPLSGSGPLISMMDLQQVNSTQSNAAGLDVIVRFVAGDHGSILNPDSATDPGPDMINIDITIEMQTQVASFLQSGGTELTITDATNIQAP